jgi:excisionase family DNA binding protein
MADQSDRRFNKPAIHDPRDGAVPRLALRPKEASQAIGIGARLLWQLTNQGRIPHVRLGKRVVYPVDQLREWLAEQSKGGGR